MHSMHSPQAMLQKVLHRSNNYGFAVQQFLTDTADPVVRMGILVQTFQTLYHAFGVGQDQHAGDPGVTVATGHLHTCQQV